MGWRGAEFKGQRVWAEVDAAGQPKVDGGRVAIRYQKSAGAKVYRAGASRVEVDPAAPVEDLEAGQSASADPAPATSKRGSGFGSAGQRTAAQARAAEQAAEKAIREAAGVVAFTDGACRGNPGQAGSGAVVVVPGRGRWEASRALGRATNNIAELTAILLAIEGLREAGVSAADPVTVFTDSRYVHGVVSLGWKAKANAALVAEIRDALGERPGLSIQWIAGHVGVEGNERADALANQGVAGVTQAGWVKS